MTMDVQNSPELVFGLIGPIGCNIDRVQSTLAHILRMFNYDSSIIRITQGMSDLLEERNFDPSTQSELATIEDKIKAGNAVRELYDNNGILAAWSITEIREKRQEHNQRRLPKDKDVDFKNVASPQTAYIIRQLKRYEEIELLRKVYEEKFIILSIVDDSHRREENLKRYLLQQNLAMSDHQAQNEAQRLIRIDEDEVEHLHGQRLMEIFHLADVFIDARDDRAIERSITRFIQALFGETNVAPTRDEFGSYIARSTSLRSVDLSRQVGAAIMSEEGDMVAIGCNEVPKPGGGNYWDEDERKWRDIDHGNEANLDEKERIIRSILDTLESENLLASGETPDDIMADPKKKDAVLKSRIGEITEYGRMVHAEMNAIADAARLGRSVRHCTTYVTTFPCHNCMKHIIASGISRVVFIEPYPKSRALQLYRYALAPDQSDGGLVQFTAFTGIAPRKFLSIFEKRGRINKDTGEVYEYDGNKMYPRVGLGTVEHIRNEIAAINENLLPTQSSADIDE